MINMYIYIYNCIPIDPKHYLFVMSGAKHRFSSGIGSKIVYPGKHSFFPETPPNGSWFVKKNGLPWSQTCLAHGLFYITSMGRCHPQTLLNLSLLVEHVLLSSARVWTTCKEWGGRVANPCWVSCANTTPRLCPSACDLGINVLKVTLSEK